MAVKHHTIRTGMEVTRSGQRGVVVDGWVPERGKNRGTVEVMWIGGSWTVAEDPDTLTPVGQSRVVDDDGRASADPGEVDASEAR